MKQAFAQCARHQHVHCHAAGRYAKYCDVLWIAAKVADVGVDPLQGQDHIEQSEVGGLALDRGMRKETQGSESIVDRHEHGGVCGMG